MEAENCSFNLCSKTSISGGALGRHLKKTHIPNSQHYSFPSSSFSSSGEDENEDEEEENGLVYGLRENPKKSFRVADPEFHPAIEAQHFAHDRESETESMTPTQKRSNRNWMMKSKEPISEKPSPAESKSEQMSSVSNTSPEEEIALCLLMLSRDEWETMNEVEDRNQSTKTKKIHRSNESTIVRTKNLCKKCKKVFRSYRALRVHRQICFRTEKESKNGGNEKTFECPFCDRVFGSGQALGGHKRSHLLSSAPAKKISNAEKSFIDLNLPVAIEEDDDYSVVSDP